MGVEKAPAVTLGMSVSPNAITRNIAKAYTDIAQQLNVVSDIFSYAQRRAVDSFDLSTRWQWTANTSITNLATINDITTGLDGTSLYLYAGTDYKLLDPLFLINNVIDNVVSQTEVRPVTVYEGMLKLKQYVQSEIANNISPIINLTSSLENFLAGTDFIGNGTAVIVQNDELSLSTWRFTEYNLGEMGAIPCLFNEFDTGIVASDNNLAIKSSSFSVLGGPVNGNFNYSTDGFSVDTQTANIDFSAIGSGYIKVSPGLTFPYLTEAPSNPPADHVKLYYDATELSFYYLDAGGAAIPLGGGSASTGLVTFDGIQIIGAGTASGDLAGNATLELVPDADLYNNDQYLIIDPTTPNHIHIRAGGNIDQSDAILILGGELAQVRVSNDDIELGDTRDHSVSIKTYDAIGTNSYEWIFGNDGKLSLPYKTVNGYYDGYLNSGSTLQLGTPESQTIITGPTPNEFFPYAQRLIVQGQKAYGTTEGGDVYIWGGPGDITSVGDPATEGSGGGDIKLRGGYSYGNKAAGYVRIEGGNSAHGGGGGFVDIKGGSCDTGPAGDILIKSGASTNDMAGNVYIESNYGSVSDGLVRIRVPKSGVGNKDWVFEPSGKLSSPGTGNSEIHIGPVTLGDTETASIFSFDDTNIGTVKVILQGRIDVGGTIYSQSCEVLCTLTGGGTGGPLQYTVYGSIYTGPDPLFTITIDSVDHAFDLKINNLNAEYLNMIAHIKTIGGF